MKNIGDIYLVEKKLCLVERENQKKKKSDPVGFWQGVTDELETQFRLLIFNIKLFSLRRTFQGIV